MATTAQTNANRENAKKSTGPRTPEGKTISSRNSLVHGMTSGKFLPPDADPQEFFQLLDQFRNRFQPFDEVEDALVERLVAAEFKMRSVRYLDAGLFHYQAETNPMPEQFNKAGRSNPLAWAFHGDSHTTTPSPSSCATRAACSANSPAPSATCPCYRMSAAPAWPKPKLPPRPILKPPKRSRANQIAPRRTQNLKKPVAVGIAVARYPPHRSVRADFPHTAPTLDGWRQSEHSDMGARCGRWESTGAPVAPCAPSRYGFAGSAGATPAASTG